MHQVEQEQTPDLGTSEVRVRLERLEGAVASSAAVLIQLLNAVNGSTANQLVMAANQARMIDALARLADPLADSRSP